MLFSLTEMKFESIMKRSQASPLTAAKQDQNKPHMAQVFRRLQAAASYRVLEQRMVFDGAIADTAAAVADSYAPTSEPAHADVAPSTTDLMQALASAPVEPVPTANTIVFIDNAVTDFEIIASGVPSGAEIVLLDAHRDGVEQMVEALAGRTGIDAIHIVSHGAEGRLYLGTGTLTVSSMQGEHLDELTVIGEALSADGDILIYGCDFAAGDAGLEAAMVLGGITGADIAASTDATGAAGLGGDWDLETSVGSIQVEAIQPVAWEHVLAPITITNLNSTTITANTLADSIAGAGITVVSATYAGDNSQAGTFTSATGYATDWLAFVSAS